MESVANWEPWESVVSFYSAGQETQNSHAYRCDLSGETGREDGPRRVLLKYSLAGTGVLYNDGKRLQLPAGHLFMIERPGPFVYAYEGDGHPWQYVFLSMYFPSIGLAQPLLPWHIRQSPIIDIRTAPELGEMIQELVHSFIADMHSDFRHSAMAYNIYTQCIEHAQAPQSAQSTRTQSQSKALQLRQILQRDFCTDVSLAQCARELAMSHEALSRNFKREFSVTPQQYVQQLRLRRSQRLLLSTSMTIVAIAGDCGFNSANYFGRVFRAWCKQTPQQYRNNPG